MADDIRLQLFIEANKQSLIDVQKAVKQSLRGIKLELDTEVSSKLRKGNILEAGSPGISSALSKVQAKQVDASRKLIEAEDKLASGLLLATFGAKTAADSLNSVDAVLENFDKLVRRNSIAFTYLNVAAGNLQQALELSREASIVSAGRLKNIVPNGLTAAMDRVEREASEAAANFASLRVDSPGKKDASSASRAFELASERLRVNLIEAQKDFEKLGFAASDGSKFLEIAIRSLVEKIGKTQFGQVLAGDRAGQASLNKPLIEQGPSLIQGSLKKSAVSAGKELEGLAAVARIQSKALGSSVREFALQISNGGKSFTQNIISSGRGLKDASVRILNQAVQAIGGLELDKDGNIIRAEGALVSELYAQIQSLQRSADSELSKEVVNHSIVGASIKMIDAIRTTIDNLQSVSTPLVPLSTRVNDLIFQFGEVPVALQKFINSTFRITQTEGETGVQLQALDSTLEKLNAESAKLITDVAGGINLDDARNVLKKFGTDFKGLVNHLLPEDELETDTDAIDTLNAQRVALLKLLTETYKNEISATAKSTAASRKAEAAKLKTSQTFANDANPVLDAELAKFKAELREVLDGLKGAGVGAARFGRTAAQFEGQLEIANIAFLSGLDQGKIAFFDIQDEGKSLADALARLRKGFQGEFFGELEVIQKQQDKEQKRILELDRKIANAKERILKEQANLIASVQGNVVEQATGAASRTSGSTNSIVNVVKNLFKKNQQDTVKAELKSFADIEKVGKTLDASGQDRFLKALKGEATTLKEVNLLFKQHQGNLAKSGALVDRLTIGLRSGEKAAFQFGFAAANAAERLTAWASPASFLFETISLLREAATNVVKLDTDLRKLVFFSPEFVATQIAALRGLDETVKQRVTTDRSYAEALEESAGSAELNVAKNLALAASFDILVKRSKDTGLAIEDISAGLLAASRVGQSAFERNAQTGELMVSTFFRAAEAFKRLEGSAASTDTIVSLLNSTLNEFTLSAENAVAVTAAIADAAGKSALEGQELFDVLVRTGAAFNLLTGASVAESLAVIQRATEANIPSVSKLATAIRQFTTLAIDNADAIERFSGIKLVEAGQIKDMQTFTSVLQKLNELAPAARNEFLALFSERDTGATILALATRAKELNADLLELGDANASAGRAFQQTKKFMEQQLFQQEDLQSSINKFKAALTELVKDSGFVDFLRSAIKGLTGMTGVVGDIAGAIEKTVGLFKLLAALAAPTIINLVKGFQKGFLARQNSFKVEQEIIDALRQENGLHEAINKAELEGLLLTKQAEQFRAQNLKLSASLLQIKSEEILLQGELAILKKDELANGERIKKIDSDLTSIESRRLAILKEESTVRSQIEAKATSSAAKAQASILAGFKNTIISAGTFAAISVLPGAVNTIASKLAGDKKVGNTVQKVFEGAVFGGLAGAAFGGLPAVVTAAIGGLAAFSEARKEAGKNAADLAQVQIEAERAGNLELKNFNVRQEARRKITEDISKAERSVVETLEEIEKIGIEINRIGAERAEKEGLVEKKQELQEKLIRAQLQLRVREKAEIAETLAFEEARTAIRERLVTVEKALSVQRQAQLALAKSFKDTKLAVDLEIRFDKRQIALQGRALQDDLNEVVSRLGALRADQAGGKAQQVKDLEKERLRIEAEIVRNKLDGVAVESAAAEKIAEEAVRAAEEQISAWTNASALVVNAFRSVISSQVEISKIIERQGETLKSIIDEETKLLLLKADNPNAGVNAFDREGQSLGTQRAALIRQLAAAQATFEKQRAVVQARSVDEVEAAAIEFRKNIQDANGGLGEFATGLDEGQRKTFRALENERATLEASIELAKANVSLQIDFTNKIIDIRRREIDIISKNIELQRKRNEADAETGRKLLKTPDAFLSEIKSISTAQAFLRGVGNGNTSGIKDRISSLQERGVGGFALLNNVLEGLEAAVRQGLVLNSGFNPEELVQVFSRLQFQSAEDVKGTTTAEKTLIGSVDAVTTSIVAEFTKQAALIGEEKKIQEQIRLNGQLQNDIAQVQSATLNKMSESAIAEARKTREDNRSVQKNIVERLETQLKQLDLDNIITKGEQQITDAIIGLGQIMNEIRESSPDVRARRKELKELGRLVFENSAAQAQVGALARNGGASGNTSISGARAAAADAEFGQTAIELRIKKLQGTLTPLQEAVDSITNIFNEQFNIANPNASKDVEEAGGGGQIINRFPVRNPVTGEETAPRIALEDVKKEIERLTKLLDVRTEERQAADRQVSVLEGIETNARRIADIQDRLQLFLSNDGAERVKQAQDLLRGIEAGFNTLKPKEIISSTNRPTSLPTIPGVGGAQGPIPLPRGAAFPPAGDFRPGHAPIPVSIQDAGPIGELGEFEKLAKTLNENAEKFAAERLQREQNRAGETDFRDASAGRKPEGIDRQANAGAIAIKLQEVADTFGEAGEQIVLLVSNFINSRVRDDGRGGVANEDVKQIVDFIKLQRELLENQQIKQVELSEQSINRFKEKLEESFNNLISQVDETRLKIDVPGVNIQLDANIKQQLQGDEFSQQLVAALQGTGLEDKVADIQGVVAKLVKTALDRGENFDGVDVVDFGGRLS